MRCDECQYWDRINLSDYVNIANYPDHGSCKEFDKDMVQDGFEMNDKLLPRRDFGCVYFKKKG